MVIRHAKLVVFNVNLIVNIDWLDLKMGWVVDEVMFKLMPFLDCSHLASGQLVAWGMCVSFLSVLGS